MLILFAVSNELLEINNKILIKNNNNDSIYIIIKKIKYWLKIYEDLWVLRDSLGSDWIVFIWIDNNIYWKAEKSKNDK